MLDIKNLNKFYKTKSETIHALKNINLTFGNHGFIVLTGKSGCGKSTLLNIIGGMDSFDDGEILIKKRSTKTFNNDSWDSYRNTYIGYVFQEFYLIDEFTIYQNISIALEIQDYPKEKIKERVKEILKQVDLVGYQDRKPKELSGGQKQRVALARALVKEPEIILADEPTGNLDSETGTTILENLKKLSETNLVIMVTHDKEFAHRYGDRIIELKDGEIIKDYYNNQVFKNINIYNDEEIVNDSLDLKNTRLPFSYAIKLALNSLLKKKFKLIFMMFLVIFSLIFIGLSNNLALYNSSKAAELTFNKTNTKIIPLLKEEYICESDNTVCYYVNSYDSYDLTLINHFNKKYPSIKFITSYDCYFYFNEIFGTHVTTSDSYYVRREFSQITIMDENQTVFKLLNGSYPETSEVAISDYTAEWLINYRAYPGVDDTIDLINKEFSLKNTKVKISGIIDTGFSKFSAYRNGGNKPSKYNLDMSSDLYTQLYMTETTYNEINSINDFSISTTQTGDNNQHWFDNASNIINIYNDNLIGRLPGNNNEIVFTLSSMINELKYPIDITNIAEIQSYLSNSYELTFHGKNQKTYQLVGIIKDNPNMKIPFNVMFSENEYLRLTSLMIDKQAKAVLGNNSRENTEFLSGLNKIHYFHDTSYSGDLYKLQDIINKAMPIFYGISAVFILFGVVLIFTFMVFSVNDKQKEIGTLRAIGAKGLDVGKIFITESLIIAVVAGIIANIGIIFITKLLSDTISKNFSLELVTIYLDPICIPLTLIIALFIVVMSTYIPIKRLTSMKPVKAIKG